MERFSYYKENEIYKIFFHVSFAFSCFSIVRRWSWCLLLLELFCSVDLLFMTRICSCTNYPLKSIYWLQSISTWTSSICSYTCCVYWRHLIKNSQKRCCLTIAYIKLSVWMICRLCSSVFWRLNLYYFFIPWILIPSWGKKKRRLFYVAKVLL